MTVSLADRMKAYEDISCAQHLIHNLPICIRVDGKAFHSWCRGLARPFDSEFHDVMAAVTAALVELTDSVIGYTYSDEISLILWNRGNPQSDIYFHGRRDKLVSVIASAATWHFQQAVSAMLPSHSSKMALFDGRVWNVPTPDEATNYLLSREQDATRNSVSMAAQECYSHKQLLGKNSKDMQEMLWQRGVNWNDYDARYKRGSVWKRVLVTRPFSAEERAALPPQHDAHVNPHLEVHRHTMMRLDLPPLGSITNRCGVLFDGENPVVDISSKPL